MKSDSKSSSAINSTTSGDVGKFSPSTDPVSEVEQENNSPQNIIDQLKVELLQKDRELEIEATLEKVRAKVMAMSASKDLNDTSLVFGEQLRKLGINWQFSYFWLIDESNNQNTFWITWPDYNTSITSYTLEEAKEYFNDCLVSWRAGVAIHDNFISPEQIQTWLDTFQRVTDNAGGEARNVMKKKTFPNGVYYYDAMMKYGSFGICINYPATEEEKNIQCRFAIEFERAYTRFLDLQHAEAQAREAQTEAALERVRAKAMGMHNSNDLTVTACAVFTELRHLGISPIRCGVGLLNRSSRKVQLYAAGSTDDGDGLAVMGWIELMGHPVLEQIYNAWVEQKEYFPEMECDELRSYYKKLHSGLSFPVPDFKREEKQFGCFLPFTVGYFYAWSDTRYEEIQLGIMRRFAGIMDLTFRRYIELQQAEANAKEALKQAALDRIRADIASMRSVRDLDRIIPLIWTELCTLGIPFIRCGVFIMNDEEQLIHTFLSAPDGKAIAAFHLDYSLTGNLAIMLDHWRNKQCYISHWTHEDFGIISDTLVEQGSFGTREQYLSTIPQGGFHLHFVPFLQGMLYVGNNEKLNDEEIELIQRIADAFSTAYARYEDFKKLEMAKQQVENTLTDLKQAQLQLVQSEKMASLGEMTAGIAHEIQNPLNFVNNFAEVNAELAAELQNELRLGHLADAEDLVQSLLENEQKILQHGKRAEAIVKGMLQHTRSGSGLKEPTDINALADEMLRLSFHGFRAKDKSFQADYTIHGESSLPPINVVPQGLSRVLLNIINNAFYAVNEKRKLGNADYKPMVDLNTICDNGKLLIIIKDNGNGIPDTIRDKIFQPFFTTKPTGQGTGLGLSMSYDIVKAHGGEINVESKEGEGSVFSISIPA
jgi:signal transduction histidine kinase